MENLEVLTHEQAEKNIIKADARNNWFKETILGLYFKCPSKIQFLLAKIFLNAVLYKNEITEIVRH